MQLRTLKDIMGNAFFEKLKDVGVHDLQTLISGSPQLGFFRKLNMHESRGRLCAFRRAFRIQDPSAMINQREHVLPAQ